YVVTERGEVFAKLDTFRNQVRVDVLEAVIEAIEIVRQRPSHSVQNPVLTNE
ncbi:MAG: late competence development ComFB family protein, partial [Thermotogaceae bacterium]|nr:late competence development ComFB family protein [Thermotogaceae bacterium]